jgi:hypothetical protein
MRRIAAIRAPTPAMFQLLNSGKQLKKIRTHSIGFGGHAQDSQYAPCIFVDNSRKDSKVLAVVHTKQVISHFLLLLVSQDSTQELFHRTISTYLDVSRIVFQLCCPRTRFVSQGVVCLHSVDVGGSWTVTVIFLNVYRGSTIFVSLYISFV